MCVQGIKSLEKNKELIYPLNLSKEQPVKYKTQDLVLSVVIKLTTHRTLSNEITCQRGP